MSVEPNKNCSAIVFSFLCDFNETVATTENFFFLPCFKIIFLVLQELYFPSLVFCVCVCAFLEWRNVCVIVACLVNTINYLLFLLYMYVSAHFFFCLSFSCQKDKKKSLTLMWARSWLYSDARISEQNSLAVWCISFVFYIFCGERMLPGVKICDTNHKLFEWMRENSLMNSIKCFGRMVFLTKPRHSFSLVAGLCIIIANNGNEAIRHWFDVKWFSIIEWKSSADGGKNPHEKIHRFSELIEASRLKCSERIMISMIRYNMHCSFTNFCSINNFRNCFLAAKNPNMMALLIVFTFTR